ncbi:hypothetical protein [Clostridium paraputrificum]|uniref:hypothetical protein n=1 Tax=Clostridium paraputrificum TaxID=29363 RepID=UPI00189B2A78|nr:hypothetical protein [Clostridium paraputrificum]
MMEDKIKLRAEEFESYDKKEIALAIRNSTLDDDMECSLLNKNIISDCKSCNLKSICDKIDRITDEYIEETTKVVGNFKF